MDNAFSLFATALRAIVDALCYRGLEFINLAAFGTDACVGRHNLCARGDWIKARCEQVIDMSATRQQDPSASLAVPSRTVQECLQPRLSSQGWQM